MTDSLEIPGYQIQSVLGEGGMATVYLSIQESLERQIALKVMHSAPVMDKTFCARFIEEGKTVARLRHPSIVNIYDIGCHNNTYYMAMEYVDGGSLTDRLKSPLGAQEALTIIRSIAGALGYAHEHGFVHRDIKPANILFREGGEATLTDFGIAKALESDKQLTQMGYAIGTPEYMSPEQARAAKLDGRSDLYSLGIVLYELLTGKRPFSSDDAFATALMHLNQPAPPLPEHLSVYQPIVDRLLAKNPDERYADARQLIQALDNVMGNRAVEYGPGSDDRTVMAPSSRVYDPGNRSDSSVEAAAGTSAAQTPVNSAEAPTEIGVPGGAGDLAAEPVLPGGAQTIPGKRWFVALLVLVPVFALAGLGYYFYADSWRSVQEPESAAQVSGKKTGVEVPVAADPPRRDAASQERINRLLQGAEAHMAIGRLKEPPGANAWDAYQMVLSMDPDNQAARQGIQEIERLESSE